MNIVLLNWTGAENDPFSYFNYLFAKEFESNGRSTITVNFDSSFVKNFSHALDLGIDFVLCWQGIGSNISNASSTTQTLWDEWQIPLICLHADHPCHAVSNHKGKSDFISHVYATKAFSEYANKYIPRNNPAFYRNFPNWFQNNCKLPEEYTGDYFVFPKNYDDSQLTLASWRQQYSKPVSDQLLAMANAIKDEFSNGNALDHHNVIDQFLTPSFYNCLRSDAKVKSIFNPHGNNMYSDIDLCHYVHSIMDKFHRNSICDHALSELSDVKMKIFGRGWDRFIALNNKNHEFALFDKVKDNDFQFHSNYGIMDVAPIYDSLHDRTFRAAANENGFLIGSSWDFQEYLGQDFSNLFYSGKQNELREKVEKIIENPSEHRALATQFGISYNQKFSFFNFLKNLEDIARPKPNQEVASTSRRVAFPA